MRIDALGSPRHGGRTDALAKPALNREAASRKPLSGTTIEGFAVDDLMSPPFDADRVAAIRKAIEQGSYPLLPAKIADAIIAGRYFLRNP